MPSAACTLHHLELSLQFSPFVSSVVGPFQFTVRLKSFKAINTLFVSKPAEVRSSHPTRLFPPRFICPSFFFISPFPFLFLWHNITGPRCAPFSEPCPSSVCCGCCAVAPNENRDYLRIYRVKKKKKKIQLNFTELSAAGKDFYRSALDSFPNKKKKPRRGERKQKMKHTRNPPRYYDVILPRDRQPKKPNLSTISA